MLGELNAQFTMSITDLTKAGFPLEDAFAIAGSMAGQRSILIPSEKGMTNQILSHAVREVQGSPYTYRAYGVLFGDASRKDLYGTYWTRDTKFYLDWFTERPWLYSHGFHRMLHDEGIQQIGVWRTAGIDEIGVFLQGELDHRHKYLASLELLAKRGLMFPSSGTLDYAARIEEDGFVSEWPLIEVSSTVAPGEWRMNPMTDDVRSAVRMFSRQGGNDTMTGIFEGLRTRLASLRTVEEDEEDPNAAQITDPPADETVTPTPPVSSADGADQGVMDAVEVRTTLDAMVDEISQQVADAAVTRTAVEAVDGVIRDISTRMATLETQIAALTASRTEQLQNMVSNGDWYNGLFSASRQSQERVPADELPPDHGGDKDGGSFFNRLVTG